MCSKHTTNNNLFAIAKRINVNFGRIFQEFVDQNRRIRRGFNRVRHVIFKIFAGIDNLHRSAAKDKRRANDYGVANTFSNIDSIIKVTGDTVRWLQELELFRADLKNSRSPARLMSSGLVPIIGTPFSWSFNDKFNGVWPPNCTIQPVRLHHLIDLKNVFNR